MIHSGFRMPFWVHPPLQCIQGGMHVSSRFSSISWQAQGHWAGLWWAEVGNNLSPWLCWVHRNWHIDGGSCPSSFLWRELELPTETWWGRWSCSVYVPLGILKELPIPVVIRSILVHEKASPLPPGKFGGHRVSVVCVSFSAWEYLVEFVVVYWYPTHGIQCQGGSTDGVWIRCRLGVQCRWWSGINCTTP